MKKIILTLCSVLIVFVCTLVGTNHCVSNKSYEMADEVNKYLLDEIRSDLDRDMRITRQSVFNYFMGNGDVTLSDSNEYVIVAEEGIPIFLDRIYTILEDFLQVTPYCSSITCIVDSAVCSEYIKGKGKTQVGCFVPSVTRADLKRTDLALSYDFMRAQHYNRLKKELKPFWTVPSRNSVVAKKLVILYIPICREDGRFFGALAVDIDVRTLDEDLRRNLPYENEMSQILILGEDGEVISSIPEDYKKASSYLVIEDSLMQHGKYYLEKEDEEGRDVFVYDGTKYYQFKSKMEEAPWRVIVICNTDAIYQSTMDIRNIIFMTSAAGMLLMLVACVVVSRQIRKNMLQKAASEQELKMAAKAQVDLLRGTEFRSGEWSLLSYMKSAKEAGGDLYDYVEKDGKLIFCIGDVAGKGMPAALFMTQVVSLFRNAVRYSDDPQKIVSNINDVLADNNPDMTFCTFFVGVLEKNTLCFCNAGHNHPILLRKKEGVTDPCYLKCSSNMAAGLMGGFPFHGEEIELEPEESILLYTDGVTEAKNRHNDYWGEEAFLKALSDVRVETERAVIDLVVHAVETFVKGQPQSDDITLLYLRKC